MTTVSTTRVDSTLSLPEAIFVYLVSDSEAMPRDVIYPPGKTNEQVETESARSMVDSRTRATVAALNVPIDRRIRQFHREHGRKLLEARLLRALGWLALLAALLAAAIGLTLQVLP